MKTQFVFFVVDFMLVSAYLLVLVQQNLRKVFAKPKVRGMAQAFKEAGRPHNGPAILP